MKSQYISENTLEYISLHDCIVENMYIEGQNLNLTFEHIDVLSEHPLNNTGYHMYTGKSQLRFIDYEIIESILYDTSELREKRKIVVEEDANKKILPISELLIDFEVLSVEEKQSDDQSYYCRVDGITSLKYNADFGYFNIKYKKLIIIWDELIEKAWFEKN